MDLLQSPAGRAPAQLHNKRVQQPRQQCEQSRPILMTDCSSPDVEQADHKRPCFLRPSAQDDCQSQGGDAIMTSPHSDISEETSFALPRECSFSSRPTIPASDLTDIDYWLQAQEHFTPRGILARQTSLNAKDREVLVEWMCEVASTFRLELETYLLAVNYMDRYLAKSYVSRAEFQLLGITCLWIAAKYEEVCVPSATELLDIADGAFSMQQMVLLEKCVMRQLEWQLAPPTTLKFLHAYLVKCKVTLQTVQALAECMLQLACLDYEVCAEQVPSRVAAAAAATALSLCGLTHCIPAVMQASEWSDTLALARMCQSIHSVFMSLSTPGAPFNSAVAHYARRQHTINQQARLDNWVAMPMMPAGPAAPTSHAPASQLAPGQAALFPQRVRRSNPPEAAPAPAATAPQASRISSDTRW